MDNITSFYFPVHICTETKPENLSQYYEIKISKLPQLTQIGTKISGTYTIKLLTPYARNISPKFNINEFHYHEEYNILKARYDKLELPKYAYKLYNDVIAHNINERLLKINSTVLNSNIYDLLVPSFLLTKSQFCSVLNYNHGNPSKNHYTENLFSNFNDGTMPAYQAKYTNVLSNEIYDDYAKIDRRVMFIRDGKPLPSHLYYHNEYQTPLRHGFYVHPDSRDSLFRFSVYKSLLQEGLNERSTEVYYDNKGICCVGSDALFCYGSLSFNIINSTKKEFDESVTNFIVHASRILHDVDPTLLINTKPRVHEFSQSKKHFDSSILPVINHTDIPTAKNLSGDIRLTQVLNSTRNDFADIDIILDKLKVTSADHATDFYNGDWSIPHTTIIPFIMGYPVTTSKYKPKPLVYNNTIQPMIGHGDDKSHYGLWLQKQDDASILDEILKFSNTMRPEFYQVNAENLAIGSMKPIFNSFSSMITKFKTSRINKSAAKLMFIMSSMILNNFDRRSDLESYRPVYNLSVLYLGAIMEPMVAITKSMGYRCDGIGLNAQAPNIMKDINDCNPEPYSIVISDIDFIGLEEDDFVDNIMNMIKLYSSPMAIKILHISSKLNNVLIANKINCYFAQLAMSSGFNERWLFVNEKGINGTYAETDGFNMFFGSKYEYYATNTVIDVDSVFRPQAYSGILTELEISTLAKYSEDCHVAQIGSVRDPIYMVAGLISTKSRNRGIQGTKAQQFSTILSKSKNNNPRFSSYSANVFDVYLDALLLEDINEFYDAHRQLFVILDIGGRSIHDLPDIYVPFKYVAVNITRDYKYTNQLDAIYNTDLTFARNMDVFLTELALPIGTQIFVMMRNFLFALPSVVSSGVAMIDFVNDVKKYNNPDVLIWMNYFGLKQSISRRFPNLKTKNWTTFEENRRYFKTLTFSTYPSDNILIGMNEDYVNSVLANPNYFSDVLESNGYTLNKNKYIVSMYLLNILQIYKSQ